MKYFSLACLLVACLFSLPGFSFTDHYVDAKLGDNFTGDGSKLAPWKTINFAVNQLPGPDRHIHAAAGVYNSALGENFPIKMRSGTSITGAGMGNTIIDSGAAVAAIQFQTDFPQAYSTFEPTSVLEELSITGFGNGVICQNTASLFSPKVVSPTLRRLRIDSRKAAIRILGGGHQSPTIADCELGPSAVGVSAAMFSASGVISITDTQFKGCQLGFRLSSNSGDPFDTVSAYIRRCEFRNCYTGAEFPVNSASGPVYIEDTLFADGTFGLVGSGNAFGGGGATIKRTTITGHSDTGVDTNNFQTVGYSISDSIIWGNAVADFDTTQTVATYFVNSSNVGTHDFGGTNISADPLFVNPATGDYRLSAASPCIDAADPAALAGGLDINGDPRHLDGDLSGSARLDMGYDEFNQVHLLIAGSGIQGTTLALTTTAPANFVTATFASSKADFALGQLGSYLIEPSTAIRLASGPAMATQTLLIPTAPGLAGRSFYFQSIGLSATTNLGSLSNRVRVTIQ